MKGINNHLAKYQKHENKCQRTSCFLTIPENIYKYKSINSTLHVFLRFSFLYQ
jgi:hypothetical protein